MSKKAIKDAKPKRDTGCHNCQHWNETTETQDEERNGECRCGPPAALCDAEGGAFSMWPFTSYQDWCGAFFPKLQ